MPASAFTEFVPLPESGRVFTSATRPGLADCAPSGRIRLDAIARWLQDIAYDDVVDAGVAGAAVWVVRRTRVRVARFPRFGERFSLRTFCSGFGRAWAERRTTIATVADQDPDPRTGRDGDHASAQEPPPAAVEAVSLWVHLDPASRHPAPLTPEEFEIYGEAAAGRRVTARLRHQAPNSATQTGRWTFRATERDLAGHINNAAYWEPLEEELLIELEPDRIDVEMEFRSPTQPGEKLVLRDGARRWIVGGDGEVHASVVLA
jgi:acyl-ACP thioesterase